MPHFLSISFFLSELAFLYDSANRKGYAKGLKFQTMCEKMLVNKLKKGDLGAFDMIYSKYKPKVFFFSWSYLKSKDKAEDVVQDVFTKVWETRQQLEEQHSFNNFLFTITKNIILNIIRKDKYEIGYRKQCGELSFFEYQENNTLDSVICEDLKSYINMEIENLPPSMRNIYKLSRIKFLSNQEIAESQKISIRTVENQIYRAVSKLKKIYLEESFVPCSD